MKLFCYFGFHNFTEEKHFKRAGLTMALTDMSEEEIQASLDDEIAKRLRGEG